MTEAATLTPGIPYDTLEAASLQQALEQRRHQFVDELVTKGLISDEFARSGMLEQFDISQETGKDTLIHIFRGDWRGGIHHLSTYIALDSSGREVEVAARVADDSKDTTYEDLRGFQSAKGNGVYNLLHIRIRDTDPLTGERTEYIKQTGSTMFPDQWSAEQIVRSIVVVAQTKPTKYDSERQVYTHTGLVDGVKIQVMSDEVTGKIIAAYPTIRQPKGRS